MQTLWPIGFGPGVIGLASGVDRFGLKVLLELSEIFALVVDLGVKLDGFPVPDGHQTHVSLVGRGLARHPCNKREGFVSYHSVRMQYAKFALKVNARLTITVELC